MEYGKYHEVEARIQKALHALSDTPGLSVAAAHRRFHVPYPRLYARHQGRDSKMKLTGPNERLSEDQDLALQTHIKRYNSYGIPALAPQLISAAQRILNTSLKLGQESTPLGRNWVTRYLKRNPHMRHTKQKYKKIERSAEKKNGLVQSSFS